MKPQKPLPIVLRDLLAQSQAVASSDPQHTLTPFNRHRIYQAIALTPRGGRMRKWLAYLTAQHVLHVWEAKQPGDPLMGDLLEMVRQYMDGEIQREVIESRANTLAQSVRQEEREAQTDLERMNAHLQETLVPRRKVREPHIYAILAAVEAAFRMLDGYHTPWDKATLKEDDTDQALNARNSDTAYYAVSAYAGGPVWAHYANNKKRLEFWQWWLDEAIPMAWEITTALDLDSESDNGKGLS